MRTAKGFEAVSAACKRVRDMDRVDGFKDRELGTILSALEAGLRHPDTGAAFDALVMLADLVNSKGIAK